MPVIVECPEIDPATRTQLDHLSRTMSEWLKTPEADVKIQETLRETDRLKAEWEKAERVDPETLRGFIS